MEFKANRFNFNFFLPSKTKVVSLEEGALSYGGATKVKDEIYSNYGEMDTIQINDGRNEVSIFIPSTIDIGKTIDSSVYMRKAFTEMLNRFYNVEIIGDCKGSWYSDTLHKVILEEITIIKAYCDNLNEDDIIFMRTLAEGIKKDMRQEGVSIGINDALAIV